MNIVELARHYIEPEAERLFSSRRVSNDFKIRQALVLLPHDSKPTVQFNEQISWKMQMDTSAFKIGQPIFLHEMRKVTGVGFPEVNGKKVAYIFMYFTGAKYSLLFDFSPNSQPEESIPDFGYPGDKVLTSYYNLFFSEMALKSLPKEKIESLKSAGLFITPAIMPYPFTVFCEPSCDAEQFLSTMHEYFSCTRLQDMANSWAETPGWVERADLINEAIENIADERYASAIALLVPQLEGTLRDAVHLLYEDDSRMSPQKAFELLSDKMGEECLSELTNNYLSSFSEFFNQKSGLFLSFKKWTDDLSDGFISRHAVSHGKHTPSMYTKDNCLRLFLILATIHDLILALNGKASSLVPS